MLSNNASAGAVLALMRRMRPKEQPDTRRAKQVKSFLSQSQSESQSQSLSLLTSRNCQQQNNIQINCILFHLS